MIPSEFVKKFYPYALETERKTGISALVVLAQAALESGWGKHAPGFMFFGIKDSDGLNGNEQLIKTTEISRRQDLKFPEIISVTPFFKNGITYFKYVVKDYFRKYNSPEESFTDHATFFTRAKRKGKLIYQKALNVKSDPYRFAEEIHKAGYATSLTYSDTLKKVINTVKKYI